jgi:hypothetical protein
MELLDTTLQSHGLGRRGLTAMASIHIKQSEAGLQALAKALAILLVFYPAATLLAYNPRLTQRSSAKTRSTAGTKRP